MTFGYVPPPFEGQWPAVRSLLDAAVQRGESDWREVESDLDEHRAQLWLTVTDRPVAAMVTRRDGDALEVWLAGGAVLSGSVPFLEIALRAAKADGAKIGRICGRKGWARVLRGYGWRADGEFLVKDLS